MNRTLRIGAQQNSDIIPHPAEVFDSLLPESASLSWAIWGDDLWIVSSSDDPSVDLSDLEDRVRAAPVVMDWTSLRGLIGELLQVIDGNFIGSHADTVIPKLRDDLNGINEAHRHAAIAVTAFDSSFWCVSAPNAVLARVAAAFPDSALCDRCL